MAREDDQRLKDMMRAIELGEIEEDILEGDQEDYEDTGGIKSLQKAPSIKMASETPGEEFDLEIMMMLKEYDDAVKNGFKGSLEDFSKYYFSKKQMQNENRQMAMYGGRMQYAQGKTVFGDIAEMDVKDEIKSTAKSFMDLFSPSQIMDMLNKAGEGIKQMYFNLKSDSQREQLLKKIYQGTEVQEKKNGGRMQYAEAGRAYEEVIDKDAEEEYYRAKAEQLDRKYNPQNYPESERDMSVEQIKKMLKKQKEETEKKAKGGIAGVL